MRGLGGKLGDYVTSVLDIETMGQLCEVPLRELNQKFEEKTAAWLALLCKGTAILIRNCIF